LRLTAKPKSVTAGGKKLDTWSWKPLSKGGVVEIRHDNSGDLRIEF